MARRDRHLRKRLLRAICRVLRHHTEFTTLNRDSRGSVLIEELFQAIQQSPRVDPSFTLAALQELLLQQTDRFEVQGERVRARYGHSVDLVDVGMPAAPPAWLYHGTSQASREAIERMGLRPKGRCHVHLTSDLDYARSVAGRAGQEPVIVRVDAEGAQRRGILFRQANRHVWLAGPIAPSLLSFDVDPRPPGVADDIIQRLAQFSSETHSFPPVRSPERWYHVCQHCTAKWFAPARRVDCPRCGRVSRARERRVPPWNAGGGTNEAGKEA
jgi:putative RNA 2'-phosphotransferase